MLPLIRLLVKLLKRIFKDKILGQDEIDKAVYLNKSTLAYPQSALTALHDESKRLFEDAIFEIVAHGLNLHRTDIKADVELKDVIKDTKEAFDLDVEKLYYKKVKTIYSKIVKYATLAQSEFTLSPTSVESYTRIKLAARNMVYTIKQIRGLRKNVNQYMVSDNKHIQKEYDRLRYKISRVLREVYLTYSGDHPNKHEEKLNKLKQKARKTDVLLDGTLDEMIKNKEVSSKMATSLANDSKTVSSVIEMLIETTELLYINTDTLALEENGENNKDS